MRSKTKLSLAIFLTILINSLSVIQISGQSPSESIRQQLLSIGITLAAQEYRLTHDIKIGSLNNKRTDTYYFQLKRGWSYIISGVCDNDCRDLDLCLYDENNNKIECDQQNDDKPLVSVTPEWTGEFKIVINMYDCRHDPCFIGIAIFGKEK